MLMALHTANDRLSAGSANSDFFIAIGIYVMVEASPELIRNQLQYLFLGRNTRSMAYNEQSILDSRQCSL